MSSCMREIAEAEAQRPRDTILPIQRVFANKFLADVDKRKSRCERFCIRRHAIRLDGHRSLLRPPMGNTICGEEKGLLVAGVSNSLLT